MSIWKCVFSSVVILLLLGFVPVDAADDTPEAKPGEAAGSSEVSAERIATLVKKLDSDKFAQRQDASRQLTAVGKPAIVALTEAATGESLEAIVRSIDVLKGFCESKDDPTKAAAREALKKVAKSDRASAARRAQDALKATEEKVRNPAGVIGPGQIQINVAGMAGGRRVSMKNINGVKEIEADEGDRKVKIVDDPAKGIKMEITTTKNGKKSTEKYEAKNADELKKKHPEAHKLYKQYSQNQGGFNVQFQIVGGNMPIRIARPAMPVPGFALPRRANSVDTAAKILSAWGTHLKNLTNDDAIGKASPESRQQLKTEVGEMKDQLAELEKRLQKAIDESAKEAKDAEQPEGKTEDAAEKKE
ncbi:MAG: hypothetical protein HQ581_07460 [Planctomycetes bacterium]|nr:hypothetical protein [Planctomycetota bacterium]